MQEVVIFGAADLAQVASAYLDADDRYSVVAFTVDEAYVGSGSLLGRDVVPFDTVEDRFPPDRYAMLVAIGYSRLNLVRIACYEACKAKGYPLLRYLDRSVLPVGPISIGDNTFVFEANVIQPFVTIGNNVVIWSGNHIGHHVSIADHCFLSSHVVVAGRASIGEACFIGANATIRDGVTVAPRTVVGAGALVMRDTKEGEVYRAKPTAAAPFSSRRLRF